MTEMEDDLIQCLHEQLVEERNRRILFEIENNQLRNELVELRLKLNFSTTLQKDLYQAIYKLQQKWTFNQCANLEEKHHSFTASGHTSDGNNLHHQFPMPLFQTGVSNVDCPEKDSQCGAPSLQNQHTLEKNAKFNKKYNLAADCKFMNKELESLQHELFSLKENKMKLKSNLKEIEQRKPILVHKKQLLESRVKKQEERQRTIQFEMQQLSERMEILSANLLACYEEQSEMIQTIMQESQGFLNTVKEKTYQEPKTEETSLIESNYISESCLAREEDVEEQMTKAEREIARLECDLKCLKMNGETSQKFEEREISFAQSCFILDDRVLKKDHNLKNGYHKRENNHLEDTMSDICSRNVSSEDKNDVLIESETKFTDIVAEQITEEVKEIIISRVNQRLNGLERSIEELQILNSPESDTKLCTGDEDRSENTMKNNYDICLDYGSGNSLNNEHNISLDYGSVMALSFFYGFLKLILPMHQIQTPHPNGIKKKIIAYMDHEHLGPDSFPVKKLFIFIPRNLDTITNLIELSKEGSDYWMEACERQLLPEICTRAGVKKRPYSVPVYKIRKPNSNNKPVYIAGTVALKSFFDVVRMNSENSKISMIFRRKQKEIISSYYRTLSETLKENDDCENLCEIIYFTNKENIAKHLLKRMAKLNPNFCRG